MNSTQRKTRVKWIVGIVVILLLTAFGSQNIYPQNLELKYPLGDIPLDPATYQRYLKVQPDRAPLEGLPTSYDARAAGIVTSAKDQGNCGSCWAFASVGAMESHMLKEFGFGPNDLSEQQQVSCNTSMAGCSGGSSEAIKYWVAKGALYESCFPYTANDSTPCSEDQCEQLDYRVVNWHTVPTTPDGFKTSLYEDGPSYWRYDVYSDFYTYWDNAAPGAVYVQASGGLLGGHAVLLIGWDDAKQAYLLKNSWGETGGPNGDGTFWVAYSGHWRDLRFGMANFSLALGCDDDGTCEEGENCTNCPNDCISGGGGGTCEDCFKGVCDGSCHPVKDGPNCADCFSSYCCGDGVCNGEENTDNCAIDCSASACVPQKKVCDCDGTCGRFESNETCPWDCP